MFHAICVWAGAAALCITFVRARSNDPFDFARAMVWPRHGQTSKRVRWAPDRRSWCPGIRRRMPTAPVGESGFRADAKSLGGSHSCRCEARRAAAFHAEGDEAISIRGMGDCFASLAMTYSAVPASDFTFTMSPGLDGLDGAVIGLYSCGPRGWAKEC